MDNLKPTEIVVSYSSLSRWHEPPPSPVKEKESHEKVKAGKGDKEKGDTSKIAEEPSATASGSQLDGQFIP